MEARKVYVVVRNDYENTEVVGVFSDPALAERVALKYSDGYLFDTEEHVVMDSIPPEIEQREDSCKLVQIFYFDVPGGLDSSATSRTVARLEDAPARVECEFNEYLSEAGRFLVAVPGNVETSEAEEISKGKFEEFTRLTNSGISEAEAIAQINQ